MACARPITEQLRIEDKAMGFMTEVTGDALEAMQDVWGERESFTRSELGGAPDWADYVDEYGELYSCNMEDEYRDFLGDLYGMVSVCGYEYDAGELLAEIDPIAFRCGMLDWIDMRVRDGDLRPIED